LDPAAGGRGGGILCPGGLTATPVIAPTGTAGKYTIYASSWDGMLHQLNVADGEDISPPTKFMPPNGKPYALNLWHDVLYNAYRAGLWRQSERRVLVRSEDQQGGHLGSGGRRDVGRSGPAIGSDGTMYTGTGDGKWDPENGVYGDGIVRAQAESGHEGARTRRLLWADPTPSGW